MPPEYGQAEELNEKIHGMVRVVEDLIKMAEKRKENPLGFVKRMFRPDLDINTIKEEEVFPRIAEEIKKAEIEELDVFEQIDQYIESKKATTSKDMPRIYRNMRDHLKAFEQFRQKRITFNDLDYTFYEDLVSFLFYDYKQPRSKTQIIGLKKNTVGKTIKQFRTFLRNRIRKKVISDIDMEGWVILEEDSDAVYCDFKEISSMFNVDLSDHPDLEEYRDDLVLACLTGLRFSDFSTLDEYDVRHDMLYKKTEKTGDWVVIPLRPEALVILQRRFVAGRCATSNAEFNKHIKTVAKLAGITNLVKHSYTKGNKKIVEVKPKYQWVCSHTGRRSFCTNEFLAGTPVELIMKISGHKSVKDFYKYIRITSEEAANLLKQLWLKRAQMSPLEQSRLAV